MMSEEELKLRLRQLEFMYNSMWYYINPALFNQARIDSKLEGQIFVYRDLLGLPRRKFNYPGARLRKGEKIDITGFEYSQEALDEMNFFEWSNVKIPTSDNWKYSNWQGLKDS